MSGTVLLAVRLALALSLYAFLGWSLLTLWQELKRQSELLSARQAPPLTLLRHTSAGLKAYRFSTSEIQVGRDTLCQCVLEDKTVSAEHARLSYHHNQWWIEDLGSRNGTYLNRQAVSSPMVVTSGDELRFGGVTFRIGIGEKDWEQEFHPQRLENRG